MAKKPASLFLCTLMILTALVGCNDTSGGNTETTAPETSIPVTGTVTETDAPEPEPEPSQYTWLVEPGKIGNDIQPAYMDSYIPLGISIIDSELLVDYSGKIIYSSFVDNGADYISSFSYCDVCDTFSDLDPDTYEKVCHWGHGGGFPSRYIYDSETGAIVIEDIMFGGYTEAKPTGTIIVAEGKKQSVTPKNEYDANFTYDMTGFYGIVVDSKLVVPFEYDTYVEFDEEGIAALRKDGKWSYFDAAGRMIFENTYSPSSNKQWISATENSEFVPYMPSGGYIALNLDGKWGFADTEGNIVIDFIFKEARPVYCGKAWVKTEEGWGVIKIDEPEIITKDEAQKAVYDKICSFNSSNVTLSDITPNGKGYYGCVGYGFDVKGDTNRYYFVNYDGTVFSPQYD